MPLQYRTCKLKVSADADETLLCRVCGVLALLCLVPESFHSQLDAEAGEVSIEIVLVNTTAREIDLLRRKLTQMTQVSGIECDRVTADAAVT